MDETKKSSSETQGTSDTQQGSETQTLDQVYAKFNVEAEASNFQPQRQEQQVQTQQPQKQEVAVPDPVLDPQGYKTWQGNQSQLVQQSLSQIQGQLSQFQRERLVQKEEADIKSAVQQFRSVTGEEVDEDMAEVALGLKARKDPKFLSVYRNRWKNPTAWKAAVSALANEFKSKSSFKIDPQIAENQRAAKLSIQGSQAKTSKDLPTGDERRFLDNNGQPLTGTAYQRAWRNYIDGGGM